ncbi:30S ribosomal protein S17 [bacterium]|nr:30S ribosomal protein S17 [bacterium]
MTERSRRKVVLGKVISNRLEKTITVLVERRIRHPLYGKYVTKSSKFMAHDQDNTCQIGDMVRIMETRPLSRCKRWRLVEIVKKAQ